MFIGVISVILKINRIDFPFNLIEYLFSYRNKRTKSEIIFMQKFYDDRLTHLNLNNNFVNITCHDP